MKKELRNKYNKYREAEYYFLCDVAVDYSSVDNIVGMVDRSISGTPSEEKFLRALDFIQYLFEKYGKHLSYTYGAGGDPIDKTPEALIEHLKNKFYAGKYEDIDYGIWFDLDESVIPLACKPPLDVKFTKYETEWKSFLAYDRAATRLADSKVDDKKIMGFQSKQGWTFRFNSGTGDFLAIHPEPCNYIATFFRPKEGIGYYLKQLKLYENQ